jgi:indole-3-glycerol phosphate synthase
MCVGQRIVFAKDDRNLEIFECVDIYQETQTMKTDRNKKALIISSSNCSKPESLNSTNQNFWNTV